MIRLPPHALSFLVEIYVKHSSSEQHRYCTLFRQSKNPISMSGITPEDLKFSKEVGGGRVKFPDIF